MIPVGIALRNFSLGTGVSRAVAELSRRLPGLGFEPVLLAHRRPRAGIRAPDGAPLRVEYAPLIPFPSRLRAASFDAWCRWRLSSRGVRLVHGQGDLTRQTVLSVHNCDAAAARHVPDGRRPSPGVEYVRRRQFGPGGCDVVIANSDMVRRDLTEFYGVRPERIRRVYLGVDLERFHPRRREEARRALLRRTGWAPETAVVLTVISGDIRKRNAGLLARAVEILAQRRPAALCAVGDAAWDREEPVRRLAEAGKFSAAPATPRVEEFYAAADVFALPAHYEEFGLTVLEALASGCPAVVGARCGAAELVREGENGRVFHDLKEPEELAAALERTLSLPGGAAAARRTAEAHSWDRHAREIVQIYREVL